MNGRIARQLRKEVSNFGVDEVSYKDKGVQPSSKTIRSRMRAFHMGLVSDTSTLGRPSIIRHLSSECNRYYYQIFKRKHKDDNRYKI